MRERMRYSLRFSFTTHPSVLESDREIASEIDRVGSIVRSIVRSIE